MGKYWGAALLAAGLAVGVEAADLLAARTFVAQLYQKRTSDRHFRLGSPRLLTPELYELIQSRPGALDYDPLCQCQDNDGLSAEIVSVTGTADQATAQVMLRFAGGRAGPPQRVILSLTHSLAGWKLADVQSARIRSLKVWLRRRS